jgi:hypothetical protein
MAALPAWFHTFCSLGVDRFAVLTQALNEARLPFDVVETGVFRHIQIRRNRSLTPQSGEKLVLAHYDRVAETPGANDNGAGVLALFDYAASRPGGLRVVFTDGEELSGRSGSDQGVFALARSWGAVRGLLPLVLDMAGLGDTLVLGHLAEHLARQIRPEPSPLEVDASARVRRAAKRLLSAFGGVEINTPFSDDLGLLLAGYPAIQLSLLPRQEAAGYRQRRASPGELSGIAAGALPPSWRAMHTADDKPETLWPESRVLVAEVLKKFEELPWLLRV